MRTYAVFETVPMLSALDADGYALVARGLTPEQCSAARQRIDALDPQHWDEAREHGSDGTSGHLDRYLNIFNRDPYWLQFLDRPGLIDLAEAALGADCHVVGQTAWRSHPGFRGEPLHADHLPLTWPEGALPDEVRVPVFIMTAQFYLNDVGPDLAPTRVVPGSHRAGRPPQAGEESWNGRAPSTVLAHAGDCLVFRSDLWHAGSDNVTGTGVRYVLQVHYGRRESAHHFSPYLDWRFDPHVLARASARQRRLLGEHEPGAYD